MADDWTCPCGCGNRAGKAHDVGPQSVPTAYTPPKYGPPPGVNPVKWRAMSRADRREHLRGLARTMNHVAHANRETCQHGQLVGQCTECQKSTGR